MSIGHGLEHAIEFAAPIAGPQQSFADAVGQARTGKGRRHAHAALDGDTRLIQLRSHLVAAAQLAADRHRLVEAVAPFDEQRQCFVYTRTVKMTQLQAEPRHVADDPGRHLAPSSAVNQQGNAQRTGRGDARDEHRMVAQHHAEAQQERGCGTSRCAAAHLTVQRGEPRDHHHQQEQRHQHAQDHHDGGIQGRADDATAQRAHHVVVAQIGVEGLDQVAGAFTRLHRRDQQRRKPTGLPHRRRQGLAFTQPRQQGRMNGCRLGRTLLRSGQGVERLDH